METTKTNTDLIAIYKKLHKVMESIEFVAKDKRNDFHKYNYASEQAIKEAVHTQLVKYGILFSGSIESINRTELKDGKNYLTDVTMLFSFIDIDTGYKLERQFIGTGIDATDKGTYKAITGAIKYVLTTQFLIPTGEDPEAATKEESKQQTKIQPNNANEDTRPWLSDSEALNYATVIEAGDMSVITDIINNFKISKKNQAVLNEAFKKAKGVTA